MATIDYKEKYERAIERARQFIEKPYLEDSAGIVGYIFPELKESEDERIRKELLENLRELSKMYDTLQTEKEYSKVQSWIAWLEKQGEQAPTEWSEKDKDNAAMLRSLIYEACNAEDATRLIQWLQSKVQPQPKQEWSEEDRRMLIGLIDELDAIMNKATPNEISVYSKYINWLKPLRPQSHWKPTGEQMEYLAKAITTLGDKGNCKTASILNDLRVELKKLMEE